MTDETRCLCEKLLRADEEDDVVSLLQKAGYWDDHRYWRHYGDIENNWGQSGNQQSLAEAALAEKIVNSVDARLINECRKRNMKPEDNDAPPTPRAAVARFFENSTGEKIATGGYIEDWDAKKTRDIAKGITLTATGKRPKGLNITVSDCGEGQSPDKLPDTILSLSKNNKQYIHFVQGQFNQGGTGALRFCGDRNLQLVISRRNPDLLPDCASVRDREWGFTVVRREYPDDTRDGRKSSVYTYLAPVGIGGGARDRCGNVLSFAAESFGIYPDDEKPYGREARYGTAIKMFDYRFTGEKSNILRGQSLLSRLDLLLPEIALPVRFYEYRTNKAGSYLDVGSRRKNLFGLLRRIRDSDNVESGFPVNIPFQPNGEKLIARVFAFVQAGSAKEKDDDDAPSTAKKLGGVRSYRKREGIVFMRNGQTQGSLPKDFFRREAVKMKPLADDLLVFVNCDGLSNKTRENLFMSSRDRLTDNEFKKMLVDSLEKTIRDCSELKALRNKRQQERTQERLEDDRPLADVLQSLKSPNLLAKILNPGQRIPTPFRTVPTGSDPKEEFKGEFYPTFFKNKGAEYGKTLDRVCPINNRMRLTFETDAQNDYFTRASERGAFDLTWTGRDGAESKTSPVGPTLKNGIATVMVDLPGEAKVGGEIEFIARTYDTLHQFENRIKVTIQTGAAQHTGGSGGRKPPKDKDGAERERPGKLALPEIDPVHRERWKEQDFDEFTAMKIKSLGYDKNETSELYEFKVNMDNEPLMNEAKAKRLSKEEVNNLRKQFMYANVLIGMSMILEDKHGSKKPAEADEDTPSEYVEDKVEWTCRALAPFIPALISLGSIDLETDDRIEGLEDSA
ncbi:MAG: hypothetical protein GDA53_05830 [Rhodobacteraceae bacterium]|nr:hypothetical protein [Paracoccaceae bacterium]